MSDNTRLIAGVRYSKDEMTFLGNETHFSTGVLGTTSAAGVSGVRVAVNPNPAESEEWSQTTWELGFEKDVFEDSMFYGSASTGFLAGGFNPNRSTFDQQEVTAYEIGLKNRLMDNRVELNVSLYRNEFEDMLAGILDAQSLTVKTNGGSITANGLEIDLKALVSENLTIVGNLAFQDSTYDVYAAANRFQLTGGLPLDANGNISLNGEDTPWAPSVSGNLNISYDIQSGTGVFTPYLQLSYSGSHTTTGLQQFALAEQDAYTKIDARLYWKSESEKWNAQVYVENLTEEEVLQHTIVGGSDIIQVSWGKPRMAGVKVGYNF